MAQSILHLFPFRWRHHLQLKSSVRAIIETVLSLMQPFVRMNTVDAR
jgi:hypothetical protein